MTNIILLCLLVYGTSAEEGHALFDEDGCPLTGVAWTAREQYCYSFSHPPHRTATWIYAENYCVENRGHLVSMHSQEENQWVFDMVYATYGSIKEYWVGFTLEYGKRTWEWSDGSPVTYTNWADGQPNYRREPTMRQGARTGRFDRTGIWFNYDGSYTSYWICKAPRGVTTPKPQPTAAATAPPRNPGPCPPFGRWEEQGGFCYDFVFDERLWANPFDADQLCQLIGGHLASIHSYTEQSYIWTTAQRQGLVNFKSIWIGLCRLNRTFERPVEEQFSWSDGTPTTFTTWRGPRFGRPGHPTEATLRPASCARMDEDPGTSSADWQDQVPTWQYRFVCKATRGEPNPPPSDPRCGPDYIKYNDVCYKPHYERVNWEGARATCEAEGAYLFFVQRKEEQTAAHFIVNRIIQEPAWVGLYDANQSEREFRWHGNWHVAHTNWQISQPVGGPGRGCVAMDTNGGWWNAFCGDMRKFVCVKTDATPQPGLPPPVPGNCQGNLEYLAYGDFCYHFSMRLGDSTTVGWSEALRRCVADGANLVSIHDMREQTMIWNEIQRRIFPTSVSPVWIGLHKESLEEDLRWTDGTPLDFAVWDNGGPNPWDKEVIHGFIRDGLWNAGLSSVYGAYYVCKKARGSNV